MTLALSLSPIAERQLANKAREEGIDLTTLAARVLEAEAERLALCGSAMTPNRATLELLAQWAAEEETIDSAEIGRRERETREFMEGMNQARLESEGPDARKIFP